MENNKITLSTDFLKTLVAANHASSKDEMRLSLCGVWWVGNELLASDGHKAAKFTVKETTDKMFFTNKDIKNIKQILKTNKRFNGEYEINGNVLSGFMEKMFLEDTKDYVTFIDIAKVMDVKHEESHCVSFNAEYLLDIARAITDKNPVVHLTFDIKNKKSTTPIIVTGPMGNGVLMPCRIK